MLVSIIMPTFNCGKYISESVDSVIAQTIRDWELIIVDDFSTDNTSIVLKPYLEKYPNIVYKRLEQNHGPAYARSTALKIARGEYIAFLDSDDLWKSDKLEKQIIFMKSNDCDFSATAYSCIDESGKEINRVITPPKKTDYNKCLRLANPLGNLTVMYNRKKLGEFEVPNIQKRNDFALWLQILKKTQYCYGMDQVLGYYRTGRNDSVSANKLKQIKYHWELYRKIEHHSIIKSIYEICCWAFVKGTGIGLRIHN